MGKSTNDDRRKYSRVGFTTRIEIRLDSGGEQKLLEANSRDLSRKGVFVKTLERFPLNSPCLVEILLTGGVEEIRLQIQGKAVRQTDDGIGIVFESMDVDTYTHLKNIVYYNGGEDGI